MTQKQLADILGYLPQTVSSWENENSTPDTDSIKKLCEIFDVSSDELLGIEREVLPQEEISNKQRDEIKNEKKLIETRYYEKDCVCAKILKIAVIVYAVLMFLVHVALFNGFILSTLLFLLIITFLQASIFVLFMLAKQKTKVFFVYTTLMIALNVVTLLPSKINANGLSVAENALTIVALLVAPLAYHRESENRKKIFGIDDGTIIYYALVVAYVILTYFVKKIGISVSIVTAVINVSTTVMLYVITTNKKQRFYYTATKTEQLLKKVEEDDCVTQGISIKGVSVANEVPLSNDNINFNAVVDKKEYVVRSGEVYQNATFVSTKTLAFFMLFSLVVSIFVSVSIEGPSNAIYFFAVALPFITCLAFFIFSRAGVVAKIIVTSLFSAFSLVCFIATYANLFSPSSAVTVAKIFASLSICATVVAGFVFYDDDTCLYKTKKIVKIVTTVISCALIVSYAIVAKSIDIQGFTVIFYWVQILVCVALAFIKSRIKINKKLIAK